jgi:hypothetical protein
MVDSSSQTPGGHWFKSQAGASIAGLGVIQGSVPLPRSTGVIDVLLVQLFWSLVFGQSMRNTSHFAFFSESSDVFS